MKPRTIPAAWRGGWRGEDGIVLVVTLWILVLMTMLGLSASVISRTDVGISGNYRAETQAFYLAEAGLQRALGSLNADASWATTLANSADAFSADKALGNGTYTVAVFPDDPVPGAIRVASTGRLNQGSAAVTVEGVLSPVDFSLFRYAVFTCSNLLLNSWHETEIENGPVYSSGNIIMTAAGAAAHIQNGDVQAMGQINLGGTAAIGGSAFANGIIHLDSSANPNVTGNATSGGFILGTGLVGGSRSANVAPAPVPDLCASPQIAAGAPTLEDIQGYRDNADVTFANLTLNTGDALPSGVVHVTGNLTVNGNATYAADTVLVVDGNVTFRADLESSPAGSTLFLFVPSGNVTAHTGAHVDINGVIQLGAAHADGSGTTGGNLILQNNSEFEVTGSVLTANGTVISNNSREFEVSYTAVQNDRLRTHFYVAQWHRL